MFGCDDDVPTRPTRSRSAIAGKILRVGVGGRRGGGLATAERPTQPPQRRPADHHRCRRSRSPSSSPPLKPETTTDPTPGPEQRALTNDLGSRMRTLLDRLPPPPVERDGEFDQNGTHATRTWTAGYR
ncbi:hypothetical protein [Prauserella flavalba]|uniref:hypothetical protein n=1 Tax=Prauserella flavalba TaxID=1477506 RepID=UPI0036EF1F12